MLTGKFLLTVAAAALVSSTALAAHNGSPLHGMKASPPHMTAGGKSVFYTGNALSASIPSFTFNNIDPGETVNCGKNPCTVTALASVQYEPGATGGGWAICQLIDGVDAQCQYYGQADTTFFVVSTVSASMAVGPGTHTVQTQIYVEQANSTLQYYNLEYHAVK